MNYRELLEAIDKANDLLERELERREAGGFSPEYVAMMNDTDTGGN